MHMRRQRRRRSFSSSSRKKCSATHATGKFPVSSRFRSRGSQSVKNSIFHSRGKVVIAKCVRIPMRELQFYLGDLWYRTGREIKTLQFQGRVQTGPFEIVWESPRQTQILKFRIKGHWTSEKCQKVTLDPSGGHWSPSGRKRWVWWRTKTARKGLNGRSEWNQAS